MAQYLPSKPAAIPLIAALAANSFHLYGNLGALQTGCIPYTQQTSSSPYERVRGTNFFIKNGIVRNPPFLDPRVHVQALPHQIEHQLTHPTHRSSPPPLSSPASSIVAQPFPPLTPTYSASLPSLPSRRSQCFLIQYW